MDDGQLEFHHYRVLTDDDGQALELGRGAMGITYRAVDTNLDVEVALKVINPRLLGDESTTRRFLREAKAAAALRHPNVASVFHLGEANNTAFYAMEFVAGETLTERVSRNGPLGTAEALTIAGQVAYALTAAEKKKVVHRDIKPDNLMIERSDDGDFHVKLIDFGLAKNLHPDAGRSSWMSLDGFVGTPIFSSPEQLEEQELDVRSDIYSLGVTLWYAITGRPPFEGGISTVLRGHLSSPPPMERLDGHPEPVRELLTKMLAKDREKRPPSATNLRREIQSCLEKLASLAATPTTDADARVANRYDLIGPANESSWGSRYRSWDGFEHREVLLDVLKTDVVQNTERLSRLEEVVKKARKLIHPNVIRCFGLESSTTDSGGMQTLLVTEYFNSVPLADVLAVQKALGVGEAVSVLEEAASASDVLVASGLLEFGLGVEDVRLGVPLDWSEKPLEEIAREPLKGWPELSVKLSPFSLQSLFRDLDGNQSDFKAEDFSAKGKARGLARLFCQSLGKGDSANNGKFHPIPEIGESANRALQECLEENRFATGSGLLKALTGVHVPTQQGAEEVDLDAPTVVMSGEKGAPTDSVSEAETEVVPNLIGKAEVGETSDPITEHPRAREGVKTAEPWQGAERAETEVGDGSWVREPIGSHDDEPKKSKLVPVIIGLVFVAAATVVAIINWPFGDKEKGTVVELPEGVGPADPTDPKDPTDPTDPPDPTDPTGPKIPFDPSKLIPDIDKLDPDDPRFLVAAPYAKDLVSAAALWKSGDRKAAAAEVAKALKHKIGRLPTVVVEFLKKVLRELANGLFGTEPEERELYQPIIDLAEQAGGPELEADVTKVKVLWALLAAREAGDYLGLARAFGDLLEAYPEPETLPAPAEKALDEVVKELADGKAGEVGPEWENVLRRAVASGTDDLMTQSLLADVVYKRDPDSAVDMYKQLLDEVVKTSSTSQFVNYCLELVGKYPAGSENDYFLDRIDSSLEDFFSLYGNSTGFMGKVDALGLEIILAAAKVGSPVAMWLAGEYYASGAGGEGSATQEENKAEAFKWYSDSAAAGYELAQYSQAECYRSGIGVTPDPAKEKEILEAIDKGVWQKIPEIVNRLAEIEPEGSERSRELFGIAQPLLKAKADEGIVRYNAPLGRILVFGLGGVSDPKAGYKLWEEGARKNDRNCYYYLGAILYQESEPQKTAGIEVDEARARQLFRQAANMGHLKAMEICDQLEIEYDK